MFSLFKKTDETIRLQSYNSGFKECEHIMRIEMNNFRKEFNDEKLKLRSEHEKALKEERKRVENNLGNKIAEQFSEISDLKFQLSKSRKGWHIFQDFIPQVMDIAHKVKSQAMSDLSKASEKLSSTDAVLYNIEHIGSRIEKMKPKVDKLIGFDEDEIIKNNKEGVK
jgi:hypothetical protein